jgi:hypothetical protein
MALAGNCVCFWMSVDLIPTKKKHPQLPAKATASTKNHIKNYYKILEDFIIIGRF